VDFFVSPRVARARCPREAADGRADANETTRHAGRAGIIREQIDGRTGR